MAGGPAPIRIELTPSERETLVHWTRRRLSPQAQALRARIVPACAEPGASDTDVARALGISRPTVITWRRRFADRRLDGLSAEPRPGAPRSITDADGERALTLTLEAEPPGATDLFAALDVRSGKIIGQCRERHRSQEFRAFLDTVERNVPSDLDVHLVLDNAATHKTEPIHRRLVKRPRFHLHFTPTSASWLNLVEGWFSLLTRRQLQRGVFRSTHALEPAIHRYIDTTNAEPKPFIWTKSADEILNTVKRFCQRTSTSDH